jgi:hypothetical protein
MRVKAYFSLSVFDISIEKNLPELEQLLSNGCSIRWFDHHVSDPLPQHDHLTCHIDTSPLVNTSFLVSRYLAKPSSAYFGIHLEAEMVTHLAGQPRAVAGMFDVIEEKGARLIPAVSMYSQSGGRVDHGVLEWFIGKTTVTIRQHMPVDGVFVSLHGATQTTACDDVCGFILEMIRQEVGQTAIISAAADLYANVTAGMICPTDTPGAATADLLSLDYEKIPKSFYPFSSLDGYQITDITYGRE